MMLLFSVAAAKFLTMVKSYQPCLIFASLTSYIWKARLSSTCMIGCRLVNLLTQIFIVQFLIWERSENKHIKESSDGFKLMEVGLRSRKGAMNCTTWLIVHCGEEIGSPRAIKPSFNPSLWKWNEISLYSIVYKWRV